jgi:hypothetical protein
MKDRNRRQDSKKAQKAKQPSTIQEYKQLKLAISAKAKKARK